MANLSTVDDMPNVTANFSDEVYQHNESFYERLFLEFFTVVGLLSEAANIIFIITIAKNKKLREDVSNVIFLHVNIIQAIYLLATPLTFRISMSFFHVSQIHAIVLCLTYQVEFNMMFGITWFHILVICDWYLKLYHEDTYQKFCRIYKFFIIMLYVVMLMGCSITVHYCLNHQMLAVTYMFMFIGVHLLATTLVIVNVVHLFKKRRILGGRKGTNGLAITNIFFILWSGVLVLLFLEFIGLKMYAPVFVIFLCVLGFSSPVFNLIYLYYCDDYYRIFLRQVIKCERNRYSNEGLESPAVRYQNVNSVAVSET
ncbi:uncharacterized protein LOC135136121 [Zophobas morio]|uniref:uncharacterized protein LOC135136121 n=1 Tax=Zophobas morio TaxID=2755281 RepID=UPI003082BC76